MMRAAMRSHFRVTRRRSIARFSQLVSVVGGVKMVTVGLLVRLYAKPGREQELEEFLQSARPLVENEPGTIAWFALKFGPFSFGIFDAFPDDAARRAHLAGGVAAALIERAEDLLAAPPNIEHLDTFASKLPQAVLSSGVARSNGGHDE